MRLYLDMRGKGADLEIARIAERQGGVVARWQLLAAGLSTQGIDRRVAAGTLRVVHRGVYALAHRRLDRVAMQRAAALAAAGDSTVSHFDAAGVWQVRRMPTGPVHLTLPGTGGRRKRRGIVLHRAALNAGDWVLRDAGLRITSPARTLLDIAPLVYPRDLERTLDEAHYRGLVSKPTLAEMLERNAGRRGAAALRTVLRGHELGSTRTESDLEEAFMLAYRERGRFPFRCQERFPPYRADLFFPAQRVIVEVDGPAHRTRRRQERDAVRDAQLDARGLPTVRVDDIEMDADLLAAVDRVDREIARLDFANRRQGA